MYKLPIHSNSAVSNNVLTALLENIQEVFELRSSQPRRNWSGWSGFG